MSNRPCDRCPRSQPLYSAGGVKLVNGNNRITLDNTLDERLRLLEDRVCFSIRSYSAVSHPLSKMLPEIRNDLYGSNENRKFYT